MAPKKDILAFRILGRPEEYPGPIATFSEVLTLMQMERVQVEHVDIFCSLSNGDGFIVPQDIYTQISPKFRSEQEAKRHLDAIDQSTEVLSSISKDKLLQVQLRSLMDLTVLRVVPPSKTREACERFEKYLLNRDNPGSSAVDSGKVEKVRQNMSPEWDVVSYEESSRSYLYQARSFPEKSPGMAVLQINDPDLMHCDKNESSTKCTVSVPLDVMDEFAIDWCKHRKLQGALGGPVGLEWGSPDCHYD